MLQSKKRTWVEIDENKIVHNYHVMDKHIHDTKIMAVVKADAYHHGDVQVATLLENEGCDFFAVSSVDEAVRLRQNGIKANILILGFTPSEHFHYLHELDIIQCVFSTEFAQELNTYATTQNVKIRVHIKVDTGMGRIGFPCLDDNYHIEEVKAVYTCDHLEVEGVFSHFSVADTFDRDDDEVYTFHQIELYERVLQDLAVANLPVKIKHIQNSYGAINYPDLPYDYARVGILLLGNTSDDAQPLKVPCELEPVLTWKAQISCVKQVKAGTYIGYGRNYQATSDIQVATVACGYADGLNRNASHKGLQVLVKGKRCTIIGNICMDQFMIDATGLDVHCEDEVTIVGIDGDEVIKIDELSRAANTINNESFTLLASRVPRFYIKKD